jgi:dienelactone hydrolase
MLILLTLAMPKISKVKYLVLHGANYPLVPKKQLLAFETQMQQANVNCQLVSYPNALHSLTNPQSGNDPSKGAAYNKDTDERSSQAVKQFFTQIFQYK